MQSYQDLIVWQRGVELVAEVYRLTRKFPKEEMFGLISQMRRAAVSIPANIAEGFSRQTLADKTHFYAMALGSLTELQSFLYNALDVGYLKESERGNLYNQSIMAHKLLTGLIKSTKRRAV